jgi:hypothetical protein
VGSATVRVEEGRSARADIRAESDRALTGRVVDGAGRPRKGFQVQARRTEPAGNVEGFFEVLVATDGEGRFLFPRCPDAPLRVTVLAPSVQGEAAIPSLVREDLRAGGEEVVLVVPDADLPSCFLEARVLDAAGAPTGAAMLQIASAGAFGGVFPDAATGRVRVGPLPPGNYRVELALEGRAAIVPREVRLEPGRTLDLGTLRFPPPSGLTIRFLRDDSSPVTGVLATLVSPEGGALRNLHLQVKDGRARWDRPPPGKHLLVVRQAAPGPGAGTVPVEIPEGGEVAVEVLLRPASHACVRLVPGPDAGPLDSVRVTVRDPSGALLCTEEGSRVSLMPPEIRPKELAGSPPGSAWCSLSLPEGTWRVEALGPRGERGAATVVAGGTPTSLPLLEIPVR